jgi:hypothetical protein
MTAQANDSVTYRDELFSLVGWEGPALFEPAEHGLHPVAISTGNWLGYLCSYVVSEGWLKLDRVTLGLSAEAQKALARGAAPALFGVLPVAGEGGYSAEYCGLAHVVPYSGVLTLGADFVWDMYVHMGYHPPWKYRRVYDLKFAAGRLVDEQDRSADMARMREAEAHGGLETLFKPLIPPSS